MNVNVTVLALGYPLEDPFSLPRVPENAAILALVLIFLENRYSTECFRVNMLPAGKKHLQTRAGRMEFAKTLSPIPFSRAVLLLSLGLW